MIAWPEVREEIASFSPHLFTPEERVTSPPPQNLSYGLHKEK